jgi:hypothetical protein
MSHTCQTTACILLLSVSLLAGCSLDRHIYESTAALPTTVTVVDQLTNVPLFEQAIPVGHAMSINIDSHFSSRQPPKSMRWSMYIASARGKGNQYTLATPYEADTIKLSGRVRIDVTHRSPELEAALQAEALPTAEIAPMIVESEDTGAAQETVEYQQVDDAEADVIADIEATVEAAQEQGVTEDTTEDVPEEQLVK